MAARAGVSEESGYCTMRECAGTTRLTASLTLKTLIASEPSGASSRAPASLEGSDFTRACAYQRFLWHSPALSCSKFHFPYQFACEVKVE